MSDGVASSKTPAPLSAGGSPAVRWSLAGWLGISRNRLIRGVIAGTLAGVVAAVGWFGVVAGTTQKQAYLIPVVGAAIAYGVHKGMGGAGRAHAIVSIVLSVIVIVVAMYYVERLLVVRWFANSGDHAAIPLVPYVDWWWSVMRHAFTRSPSPAVYAVLAVAAAGWLGHQGFEAPHPSRHHDA